MPTRTTGLAKLCTLFVNLYVPVLGLSILWGLASLVGLHPDLHLLWYEASGVMEGSGALHPVVIATVLAPVAFALGGEAAATSDRRSIALAGSAAGLGLAVTSAVVILGSLTETMATLAQ